MRQFLPSQLREALLRRSVAMADEDAKFRVGQPTMWGSLQNLAQWFTPGGIIDIGANIGDWSRSAATIFPGVPIHMIEAQPGLEAQLRTTGFPYSITLLGPECRASVPFHLLGTGSSVIEEVTGFHKDQAWLPMRRLDDLGLDLPRPLLIKLDVQGYELEVLSGATETLTRTEVIVTEVAFLEYNRGAPLIHEVIAWMAGRDFVPFDICGGWRRSSDQALAQTDVIFVRKQSPLRAKRKFFAHEP